MAKVRILSIDGGGIRGIIPGTILIYVEQKLQELSGNPDARIADYFDLIAGTSTGGILACAYLLPNEYGKPEFKASDAVDIYLKRGGEIFDRDFWHTVRSGAGWIDEKYPHKNLEKTLKEYFNTAKLSELLRPSLITAYETRKRDGFFMKSHKAVNSGAYDFSVWEVARATSAAPTYFEAAQITSDDDEVYTLIDGGVFVNNPALCAYAEARTLNFKHRGVDKPTAEDMLILSLGTGKQHKPYEYNDIKNYGNVHWAEPAIDIMMSGGAQVVDYQLEQIFDTLKDNKKGYQRFQLSISQYNEKGFNIDSAMDNVTYENMNELRRGAEALLADKDEKKRLDDFVIQLLEPDVEYDTE